jgi:hypothetical protein
MPRNPARSREEVLETFRKLLLDPDVLQSMEAAEDLLLENNVTLVEVSEALMPKDWRTGWWETEKDARAGAFVISEVAEAYEYEDGIAWYVAKTATGRMWFIHLEAHVNGATYSVFGSRPGTGHNRQRYSSAESAVAAAVRLAWNETEVLRLFRDEDPEELRHLMLGAAGAAGRGSKLAALDSDRTIAPELLGLGDLNWMTKNPTVRPAQRGRGLRDNPGWVTQALARSYETMEARVPPQWMPKLEDTGAQRGRLTAAIHEYGCGAYGCVLPTLDAETVLKVTTDETEAQFAARWSEQLAAPVTVEYRMVMQLPSKHQGRGIFLMWRESATDVGAVEKVLGKEAARLVDYQHRLAQQAFVIVDAAMVRGTMDQKTPELLSALAEWRHSLTYMGEHHSLRQLALGMMKVYDEQGIFFGDVHEGNLGRVQRGKNQPWVITDPGHVVVLER